MTDRILTKAEVEVWAMAAAEVEALAKELSALQILLGMREPVQNVLGRLAALTAQWRGKE